MRKLNLRRSDVELFYKCKFAFYRKMFENVEPILNDKIIKGQKRHQELDEMLKNNEIPVELIPFFNEIGEDVKYKNEVKYVEKNSEQNIILNGTIDLLLFSNGVPKYIIDYKTTENFHDTYYYKTSLIQPNIYSYLVFNFYPKLERIEFQYWFPYCEPKNSIKFVLHKDEVNKAVKTYKDEILYALDNNLFIPFVSKQCENCLYRCDEVFETSMVVNKKYVDKEKENIYMLLSKLNSQEDVLANIEKIKIYRNKLKTILNEVKILDKMFDDKLKKLLPDEYLEVKTIRYLKVGIWKWLLNKGVKIDEIFSKYVGNISITQVEKKFKDIPKHYIKESKRTYIKLDKEVSNDEKN